MEGIPEEKAALLHTLTAELQRVEGVAAVALGGSYAAGTQHAGSDLDVGIYYHEVQPFDIEQIRRVAEGISIRGEPVVTGFYGWGAWVNGGAWIHTAAGKVDFLYRNLEQIERTIDEAQQGITAHDYPQQPAYGFYSVIYLAEVQICMPLFDPEGVLARLKQRVAVYPPKLKEKLVSDCLWSAEFTLLHGRGFAANGDIYNTAGCLTRAAGNLTQALFALNECYFMRDKRVMEKMASFRVLPEGYAADLERILAAAGSTPEELTRSIEAMQALWLKVVALTRGEYRAQFTL